MEYPNHYYEYSKKSGQIPAFGNWDYANQLPITQYFECARQAGLIRYSNSSCDGDAYLPRGDLYAVDLHHHYQKPHVHRPKANVNKRCSQVKESKKVKVKVVCDVADPPRKLLRNDAVPRPTPRIVPKPVDEDLYKIPPELVHASKRKRRLGIFSRCLVPACTY